MINRPIVSEPLTGNSFYGSPTRYSHSISKNSKIVIHAVD